MHRSCGHTGVAMMKAETIEGCVAFLDILGFSARVHTDTFEAEFEHYSKALMTAVTTSPPLGFAAFSDSIVIHTTDASPESLVSIVKAVSHLLFEFITHGMPVRGAVAFGRFHRADQGANSIIAGRPIIEAYEAEQQQDWVGVMLCPSLLRHFDVAVVAAHDDGPAALDRSHPAGQRRFDLAWRLRSAYIPWHGDKRPLHSVAILPIRMDPVETESPPVRVSRIIAEYGVCHRSLERLRWQSPEPASQAKYVSTLAWLEGTYLGKFRCKTEGGN